MPYKNRYVRGRLIFCLAMLFVAGFLQFLDRGNTLFDFFLGRVPVIIYIFLLLYWQRALRRRIIHRRFVQILTQICNLLMFWIFLREARYVWFLDVPIITHYAWYLYYVPQILVPMLGFFSIDLIGKDEKEHVNKELLFLWVPALLLIGLVLTNDLHQLVFPFSNDALTQNYLYDVSGVYAWSMGFVIILAWMFSLLLGAILLLYSKSTLTVSKEKAIVPVIIFLLGSAMCILNGVGLQNWYHMPEMYSITYILAFESCIQIGLIPSNSGYERFFAASKVPAKLVDPMGHTAYVSGHEKKVEELRAPGWRVCEAKVEGGTFYWAEDLREMLKLKHYLEEAKEQLSENYKLMEAENSLEEHRIRTEEKGRLYDTLSSFMRDYLEELETIIADAEKAQDPTEALQSACLLTCYLKRRSNLMLFHGEDKNNGGAELEHCIREFTIYLNLRGIRTSFNGREIKHFTTDEAIVVFDRFVLIMHRIMPRMKYLNISLDDTGKVPCLRLMIDGDLKVGDLADFEAVEEDGAIFLVLPLKEGGAANVL